MKIDVLSRLKSKGITATTRSVMKAARNQAKSLEEQRTSVSEKLLANAAHVRDPKTFEKPDQVYKRTGDGKCQVGVKCGNTYLKEIFEGGDGIVEVSEEKLADTLEDLAAATDERSFDEAIKAVMKANAEKRSRH